MIEQLKIFGIVFLLIILTKVLWKVFLRIVKIIWTIIKWPLLIFVIILFEITGGKDRD